MRLFSLLFILITQPLFASDLMLCPVKQVIKSVCHGGDQIFTDITISKNASVSNIVLQGNVTNQGFASNLKILKETHFSGGHVSGYVDNQGTMENFVFTGAELTGGKLAGIVENQSTIKGKIKDVKLAPNTIIRGGIIAGKIEGDEYAPALLENVTIQAGSQLSGVIGQSIKQEDNVTIKPALPPLETNILYADSPTYVASKLYAGIAIDDGIYRQAVTTLPIHNLHIQAHIQAHSEPDKDHIGQVADILAYVAYMPRIDSIPRSDLVIFYVLDSNGKFKQWNDSLTKIDTIVKQIKLEKEQTIDLYNAQLPANLFTQGRLEFYFGYRLPNNTFVTHQPALSIQLNPNPMDAGNFYNKPYLPNSTRIAILDDTTVNVSWLPAQADSDVIYEVHLSETAWFTPNRDTLFTGSVEPYAVLKNLQPDTTYHVLVIAKDREGKISQTQDYQTFKTPLQTPHYISYPSPYTTLQFRDTPINNASNLTINISPSIKPLIIESVKIIGEHADEFGLAQTRYPLNIEKRTLLQVRCYPYTIGQKTAQLLLQTNDPENQEVIYDLSCHAIPEQIIKQPSSNIEKQIAASLISEPSVNSLLDFGAVEINQTQHLTLRLSGREITITDYQLTGHHHTAFRVNHDFPIDLTTAQTIDIQCTPFAETHYESQLILTTEITNYVYDLSCEGIKATTTSDNTDNNQNDVVLPPTQAPPVDETDNESIETDFDHSKVKKAKVAPGKAIKLRNGHAALNVNNRAVNKETQLGIRDLASEDLPDLDSGLINVTKGSSGNGRGKGYRMLPHGMKFRNNIKIHLGYDKNLIPDGYSEEQIKTYYFDDQAGYWKPLERVEIDVDNEEIISHTNHFTDMINAVATVPDHPETQSINETTFKDMKAADPSAGMTIIEPPAANNMGDVRLSYPLELPAGRVGMQPQLTCSYNSGGGNGWLGLGWSLSIPEIGIDTRWGVPRYDGSLETETYIFNGEQLTPVAHRTELVPRQTEKTFYPRIESAFMLITRHGDNPKNYWWEVKDKNGMTYIYGRSDQARLMDDSGNIFKWALEQTIDTHNNTVNYHYATVQSTGLSGGSVIGRDLYIHSIDYTGYKTSKGLYRVDFIRDRQLTETQRNDVIISGRGGFKQVTADLLRKVKIYYKNELSRSYEFIYQQGAFGKTLLASVLQKGKDGGDFYAHTFEYYNDVAGGLFGSSQGWNTRNDGVSAGFFGYGNASAISGNKSDAMGGHLYIGINLLMPTKQMSIGGKGGYSRTKSEGMLVQIDINGDGLPDKVYRKGNSIYYRPNLSGPDGGEVFGNSYHVGNLSRISKGRSSMYSGGAELYMGASVGVNVAGTFSRTSVFFTEVNGDGCPDIVDNGRVLFNHCDGNEHPYFSPNAADTPYPIGQSAVNTADLMQDHEELKQEFDQANPLLDTVKRWTAPFDGEIQITGDVTLATPTELEGTEDGVKVTIQHNDTELWTTAIAAGDHTVKTPQVATLTVKKGDSIYFRIQSQFDGANDNVQWSPEILYLDCEEMDETLEPRSPLLDANGFNQCRYNVTKDFALSGYQDMHMNMPLEGQVQISATLQKTAITTDDVGIQILRNDTIIYENTLTWQQVDQIEISELVDVVKEDKIAVRIKIDSPIDLSTIQWSQAPKLTYISSPDVPNLQDPDGNYVVSIDLVYGFDVYAETNLSEPLQAWIAPATGQYTVSPLLALNPAEPKEETPQAENEEGSTEKTIYMTVKRQDELVEKYEILVIDGAIQQQESFTIQAEAGERLFFEFSSRDFNADEFSQVAAGISGNGASDSLSPALHTFGENQIIAPAYRQWTVFGYDGSGDNQTQPLNITEEDLNGESFKAQVETLQAQQDQIPDKDTFLDEEVELNLPAKPRLKVLPFYPKPAKNRWQSPDENTWVDATAMSSGRQGLNSFDIPSASSFTGRRGIIKYSNSRQMSVMLGAGFLSGSISRTSTRGFGEMMDFNGDRFVDILSGCIQYTNMLGVLEGGCRTNISNEVRATKGNGMNFGIGGNFPLTKTRGSGRAGPTNNQMASLGISGNLTTADNKTLHDIMDVNGDGLPDLVFEGLSVALNLGYRFASPEPWGSADINTTKNMGLSLGASAGFNEGTYGISAGLSLSKSESESIKILLDINGDGSLDSIQNESVKYNTGNGFKGGSQSTKESTTNADITLGTGVYFTIGIPIGAPPLGFYIIINPGFDVNRTVNRQEIAFSDVDGDGNPDLIKSEDDGSMTVHPSNVRRTNMLKTVHNPLGGTMTVDYARTGNTFEQPQNRWVMSRLEINDGHAGDGVDTQVKTFHYEDGFYHRQERDFYGFAKVIEQHLDNNNAIYRSITRLFHNTSYYNKGLLYQETTTDGQGRKWLETENQYTLLNLDTNAALANLNHLTARVFPQLVRTDERFYEGQASATKSTYTMQRYDEYGNVIGLFDAADVGNSDDIEAEITYFKDTANYIVGKANGIIVKGGGNVMRRRVAAFQAGTGDLVQIQEFLASGNTALTDISYDQYGNITSLLSPANYKGQRYRLDYQYDNQVHTHNIQVTDSFGYVSKANYDLVFGKVKQTIDINQQPIDYVYDEFGRVIQLIGPYQTGSGLYTLEFEYHQNARPAWALTKHIDVYRDSNDPIETVVLIDGLKRPIQTKKDLTIHQNENAKAKDVMQVSGLVMYDFLEHTVEQYYPITENLGHQGKFNPAVDTIAPTRTTYDVLDRTLTVTIPDQTTTTSVYGFGTDRDGKTQFLTRVIDANGIAKETYKDIRGVITAVKEFNNGGQQVLWTSYSYDPLKQIIEVKDDQNNLTTVGYDNLGRRVSIDNPDTGLVETFYDLASNVTKKVTPNLRAEGQAIEYSYDYNRLLTTTYPNYSENNVTYTYGAPNASYHRANRIVMVTDESGSEEFFYGKLGEVVKTIKTVNSDTQGGSFNSPEIYTTQFEYDTFNRLQVLTYPDGEVLANHYDSGGLLRAITGYKTGNDYDYLDRLEYDKFEQRVFVKYGNGVKSKYSYNPLNRRLDNLWSQTTVKKQIFQDLNYDYDAVGNILGQANLAAVKSASQMGGATQYQYQYDDLYRLIGATGTFDYEPDKRHSYRLKMEYDSIHNILHKDQYHEHKEPSGVVNVQKKTTYDWTYEYGGQQPHAPTHIGLRTFGYDANGNQMGWTNDENGTYRVIKWDEENRIQEIIDNNRVHSYKYNHAGERVIKSTSQGETAYINQYFVIRNGSVATKHVFAGSTRMVSKLTMQENTTITQQNSSNTRGGTRNSGKSKKPDIPPGQVDNDNSNACSSGNPGFCDSGSIDDIAEPLPDTSTPIETPNTSDDGSTSSGDDTTTTPVDTGNSGSNHGQDNQVNSQDDKTNNGDSNNVTPTKPEKPKPVKPPKNKGPYEHQMYFYHPDHLGSTGYVTNDKGRIYQHLEYFPFGETFVEQLSNTQRTPYLFTGKEYDEEVGLYYFGARYYAPRTSVWLSVDPILAEYLPTGDKEQDQNLRGMGGVFNSFNLGLYAYSHLNPVKFVDPDGNEPSNSCYLTHPNPQEYYYNKGYSTLSYNQEYGLYGTSRGRWHRGVDVSGNIGDPVYATVDGRATAHNYGPLGQFVRIEDSDGYYNEFGHLSEIFIKNNQDVEKGDLIGLMGRTGNIAGTNYPTHVHINRWRKDSVVDGVITDWDDPTLQTFGSILPRCDNCVEREIPLEFEIERVE